MRFVAIVSMLVALSLSSCVLKHNPTAPSMTFKVGPAYKPDSSVVDTSATVLVGFSANRANSNMRYLQVTKAIDTMTPVVLTAYVLLDTQLTSVNKDFSFKTGGYRTDKTETYTFKISDEEGYTFQKSIAFIVHPH